MRSAVPFFASLRASLVFLVLVAILPVLAGSMCTGLFLYNSMLRSAEDQALREVRAMAAHHRRVVDTARLLLETLAKTGAMQLRNPSSLQALLEEMLSRNAAYAALGLADIHGNIVAASPEDAFSELDRKRYFKDALTARSFVTGTYHLMPDRRRVVVEFAQPVLDKGGRVRGVLMAMFDLGYFGHVFEDARLPVGSIFTLTAADGTRLTRFPEAEKYTWVPDLPRMVRRMSGGPEEGTFLEQGVDGVRRLYSFTRIHVADDPSQCLMLRLGQPEDTALADARGSIAFNVVLIFLATLLAVGAAWAIAEHAIARGVRQLVQAANRLGTGDLSARTGLTHGRGELGTLAEAFDRMASGLEDYDWERRRAEEEVCLLNMELEERVSARTAALAKANASLQEALENLRQTQGQLVLSEKLAALGELVAGVAHEINTPVGVALSATSTVANRCRSLSDLFARGEMKRSDLTEYLGSVQEGVEMSLLNLHRASDLIRSFKMVAADQVSEARRTFNVRQYVAEVLLSLRPKLKKTSHQIVVNCDDALVIESYPGAFSQILTNFLLNSLTHAFAEGQAGEITIDIARSERELILTYGDNGRGIPAEVQDKIFEPFYTTARSRGSTGLGLHIVFNIVTRTLGGTVTCCSAPGHGTTFQVRVPLQREDV